MDRVRPASERAGSLAAQLDAAALAFIRVIAGLEPARWDRVPAPGVWSVGKDTEHLSEAAAYHQWIVRLSIGEKVASRRPSIERSRLTTTLSSREAVDLLRLRTDAGMGLVAGLTDDQLDLPTRPPRAGTPSLATTIRRVLIGHYLDHRGAIEAKLRAMG